MTSPNFDPLYSTDNIWLKADEDTCLSDHLDGMASDIESKAPASHTHSGYAPADHTHTGYASSDHAHTGYAESSHTHTPASIGAAPASHSHDYAAPAHGHAQSDIEGLATALAGKAATNHTHGADVITANLEATTYNAPIGGTWTNIPLTNLVLVGDSFALIDNQVRIGAGVSKVMVSAQICVGSANAAGNKYFAIRKNAAQDKARTQMRLHEAYTPETMCIPPLLIDVAEGDLLTLDYSGTQGDAIYGDLIFTYLTVQKIA